MGTCGGVKCYEESGFGYPRRWEHSSSRLERSVGKNGKSKPRNSEILGKHSRHKGCHHPFSSIGRTFFLWKLAWVPPLWGVNWQQVDGKESKSFPHTPHSVHSWLQTSSPSPTPSPHIKPPPRCLSGKGEDGEDCKVVPP